eukprot:1325869-Amorphochlora_amoeboformis.AAC.1
MSEANKVRLGTSPGSNLRGYSEYETLCWLSRGNTNSILILRFSSSAALGEIANQRAAKWNNSPLLEMET